jgi:hypothetical protein
MTENPMHRFVHVGLIFPGVPKVRDLELPFSVVGDWVRYAFNCWIVWTDKPIPEIYTILRQRLDRDDQILIAPIDVSHSIGYLTPWIWHWMQSKGAVLAGDQPTQNVLSHYTLPKT